MDVQKDPEGNETEYLLKCVNVQARRILEIGCGDGRLTWRYASTVKQIVGIDLERDELRVAKIERPFDLERRVSFALADSIHLPFRPGSFDLAIFAWSF